MTILIQTLVVASVDTDTLLIALSSSAVSLTSMAVLGTSDSESAET